uniref:Uncharacterized protein n=1 Tax=Salmonella enterica TaxID=28901 RepID=A0A750KK64_SALER
MDNTYICEQEIVSRRHTNYLKKWRDNGHINHILFDLSHNSYDGTTQSKQKTALFFKKINHNFLLSFVPPAHRQRMTSSEHRYCKKIIT